MSAVLTTPPASEPVDLALVKENMLVEHALQDNVITQAIKAARDLIEQRTGYYMMTQTWTLYFDAFSAIVELPYRPIQSVVVKYDDDDGVEQTLADTAYQLDLASYPARIEFSDPPTVRDGIHAIRVECVLGHANAGLVPPVLTQAILLCVGTWYQNREGVVVGAVTNELPMGVQAAIDAHKFYCL